MKRSFIPIILFSGMILLNSCGADHPESEQVLSAAGDSTKTGQQKISDEAIGDIIKSIPSPIEISVLIKETGGAYNKSLLNENDNYSKYNSSFQKALNLGIYGADLGYINIYNQNRDAMVYLSSIKSLADDLNIGQFYDFTTIKRLATNSNNIDSLLQITTMNFERINNFLYEKKRSEQCVLILLGGWMEGLHISCEVAKASKNEKIVEKIGEQKIVLEQLILLLSNYQHQANIKLLYDDLLSLKKVYDKVTITYEYHESTMKEVNGVLMIVDETESKVSITPEQVQEIDTIISDLRGKIIL